MKANGMKEKLLAGEAVYGVSLMFPSPQMVEMIGALGFDWVLIDCEHGGISPESVELMAMAADAAGITPIARPCANSPEAILQVMDRGAMGVQVPHVNTADDARRAVESVKYHPLGSRGLGGGNRPTGYGQGEPVDRYVETANRETLVCVQLEEVEGIRNVDEILEVEGVDVLFIGALDLSQSMGVPGRPDDPGVREAVDRTFAKILGAGRIAGCSGDAEPTAARQKQGVRYFYTHIPRLLSIGSGEFFRAVRG